MSTCLTQLTLGPYVANFSTKVFETIQVVSSSLDSGKEEEEGPRTRMDWRIEPMRVLLEVISVSSRNAESACSEKGIQTPMARGRST